MAEQHGGITPEALVASAMHELDLFGEVGFDDVKISVKASNVPLMIDAYRLLSETTDHPLHLGVTEAGPLPARARSSRPPASRTLLAEGIGDTIRFSLTADPVEEAKAGRTLLEALGLRERKGLDLIACPSCGRAEVDVIRVASDAQAALEDAQHPAAGRGDGLRRERSGRGARGRPRHRRRPRQGPPVRARARSCGSCPRPRWSTRWSTRPSGSWPRASRPALAAADAGAAAEARGDPGGAARRAGRRRQRRRHSASRRSGTSPGRVGSMRMSRLFLRTLRDDPADAEVDSHRLLVRAGYIRRVAAGIYSWLPLGYRVLRKVEQIVREEMDAAGAQEVLLPIVQPLELWERTRPRQGVRRRSCSASHDRKETGYCLSPTAEEVVTTLVAQEYGSLPRPAGEPVPDQLEVPRRAPAPLRAAPRPRVPDEGRLLLRRSTSRACERATSRCTTPTTACSSAAG